VKPSYAPLTPPPASTEPTGISRINATLDNVLDLWGPDMYRPTCQEDRLLGYKIVTTSDPDIAKQILLTSNDHFRRSHMNRKILGPVMGHSVLCTDSDEWRRQRKILSVAFRPQNMHDLIPAMARQANDLVDRLHQSEGAVTDIMDEMIEATYLITMVLLYGTEQTKAMSPEVLEIGETYLDSIGKIRFVDVLPLVGPIARLRKWRGYRAAQLFRRHIVSGLEHHLADRKAEDLCLASLLVDARDPDTGASLTHDQIIDNLIGFAAAGHHTTALALTWTLHCLSHQPDLWAELAAESHRVAPEGVTGNKELSGLALHEQVILETMRLFPPLPILRREVADPVTVGPYRVDTGDQVAIAVYPMQRSESLWNNPAAFDKNRFSPENRKKMHRFQFVPFGGGPHVCIGMTLSMWEMKVLLSSLTRSLRFEPAMEPEDVLPVAAVTLRPKNGLRLKVLPGC